MRHIMTHLTVCDVTATDSDLMCLVTVHTTKEPSTLNLASSLNAANGC